MLLVATREMHQVNGGCHSPARRGRRPTGAVGSLAAGSRTGARDSPKQIILEPPARRVGHPIVDMGTTTVPHMSRILDEIDTALADDRTVYVHCWGGRGRTGTVVGCWLMRHGLDGGDAIRHIAELRRDVEDARMPSPETSAQRAMVTGWKRGR